MVWFAKAKLTGSGGGEHLEPQGQPLMAARPGHRAQEADHHQQEAAVEALPGGGEAVALPDDANLGQSLSIVRQE